MTHHRLYIGDALEVLRTLPDESVDLSRSVWACPVVDWGSVDTDLHEWFAKGVVPVGIGATNHVIYIGDVLSVLRTLADESVHCVVTSPPY